MIETQPSCTGYSTPASAQVNVWSQDCLSWFKRSVTSQHNPHCQTFAILLGRFKRTGPEHRLWRLLLCVLHLQKKNPRIFPPVYFYLVSSWSTVPREIVRTMKPHWQDGNRLSCYFLSFELSNLGLITAFLPVWFTVTFPAMWSSMISNSTM